MGNPEFTAICKNKTITFKMLKKKQKNEVENLIEASGHHHTASRFILVVKGLDLQQGFVK